MAPPKGKICFECQAADGHLVRLFKHRYYSHILLEHPEFERDFQYPVAEIERAVKTAAQIRQGQGGARIYIGPTIEAISDAGQIRVQVVVNVKEADGWVITAYIEPVLD